MFQRSILEADQDEITEEDGDMNNDKLNELIGRHKSEVAISMRWIYKGRKTH